MGKNQAHKQMQRAKMSSHAATGPDEEINDGMMDGSFHSPEWHAARLAALQTSHTVTWEEWKQKQKEEAKKKEELAGDEEKRMKEYRAQLDAERASKLARGRNHTDKKDKKKGKKDKDKDGSKSEKKKKRREREKRSRKRDDSGSDTEESESESDREIKRERKKPKKEKRSKKKRRHSDSESSSGESGDEGPVRLSSFFKD